jgi:uncharacterized protein (TIGR00661 family)
MKVLYAIQGTGNGHVSRANEIIPILKQKCEVDILLSGTQADVGVNLPLKYKLKGLSFVFGKKGGIDFYKTFKQLQSKKFLKEIKSLPVENYDLVINDFEPVSAWACRRKNIPCIAMSHQFGVLHKEAPRPPSNDPFAMLVLKYYAPCKEGVGFHFKKYGNNIFTPVIRREIRNAEVTNKGHYTVYLPAYSDKKIISFLSNFKDIEWQVFSKHTKKFYKEKNCLVQPVNAKFFTESFISCEGILCGAGFETPAEALYMGKKLLVVPMKQQYEQHCNAAGAADLGVPVIKSLKKKHIEKAAQWLYHSQPIKVDYPDETSIIIDTILKRIEDIADRKEKYISPLPGFNNIPAFQS